MSAIGLLSEYVDKGERDMKKKIFSLIMVIAVMCCSLSTIVLRSNAISSELDVNRFVSQLKTELNANFQSGLDAQKISEALNTDYIDINKYYDIFSQLQITDKIPVNQYSRGYLEYALLATQFLNAVETNKLTLTEQQACALRDQCNQIFDTLDTLRNTIVKNTNDLNTHELFALHTIYLSLQTREEQIAALFPTDYERQFMRNAELTKHCIITEYCSITELRDKGTRFIQRIDDLILKVKQGGIDPIEGNKQIDAIWDEWLKQYACRAVAE